MRRRVTGGQVVDDVHSIGPHGFRAIVLDSEGNRLALPILGTRESITEMDVDTVHGYWQRRYVPASLVVAVAGNIRHEEVVALTRERFGGWAGRPNGHEGLPPAQDERLPAV